MTTLVVMLIPNTALVLPIFLELSAPCDLIGNPLAVILPFSFFPFGVYLTYIYFSTSIPRGPAGRGADRRRERVPGVPPDRPAAGDAGDRAGRVLQLRGQLEQLLPAVPDGARARRSPIQVGLAELLSNVPAFNPTTVGVRLDPAADPGAGDAALGRAGAAHLPVLPALPGRGDDRGRDEGVSGGIQRHALVVGVRPEKREEYLAAALRRLAAGRGDALGRAMSRTTRSSCSATRSSPTTSTSATTTTPTWRGSATTP